MGGADSVGRLGTALGFVKHGVHLKHLFKVGKSERGWIEFRQLETVVKGTK